MASDESIRHPTTEGNRDIKPQIHRVLSLALKAKPAFVTPHRDNGNVKCTRLVPGNGLELAYILPECVYSAVPVQIYKRRRSAIESGKGF